MTTLLNNLSAADLHRAADLRDQIDAAQSELEAILGGTPGHKKPGPKLKAEKATKKKPKRKVSAAGRARIAAAQKKRWAAKRKADKAAAKAEK